MSKDDCIAKRTRSRIGLALTNIQQMAPLPVTHFNEAAQTFNSANVVVENVSGNDRDIHQQSTPLKPINSGQNIQQICSIIANTPESEKRKQPSFTSFSPSHTNACKKLDLNEESNSKLQ